MSLNVTQRKVVNVLKLHDLQEAITHISMAMLWNGEGRFEVDIVILSIGF